MKNSMGDAMEQIRLGNYKAAIGGGGRASSVNEILRPGGQQIGKVVNRGD